MAENICEPDIDAQATQLLRAGCGLNNTHMAIVTAACHAAQMHAGSCSSQDESLPEQFSVHTTKSKLGRCPDSSCSGAYLLEPSARG